VTVQTYNARGLLAALTDPDNNTTTWEYDGAGRVATAVASNSAAVLQGAGLRQGAGFDSFVEHSIHGGIFDVAEACGGFHSV
ncbi:MAG: RHS repeat domain-containing protein, partial [Bryobacteraceae bacterium]